MPHELVLNIAAVNVRIRCSDASLEHAAGPAYAPFLGAAPQGEGTLEIGVEVEIGGLPPTDGFTSLFDSGGSWVLLSDGAWYYVVLRPAALGAEPLWIARTARDFSSAVVHCGARLVMGAGRDAIVINPVHYPLDQIMLIQFLGARDGVLIHAAGVDVGGRGFIFPGRSGAGKSTISRELVGRRGMRLLSDDRIVARRVGGRFAAYGTPWAGDQGAALNRSVPLCGMCFLRHADHDRVVPLAPPEALERLLPVASIPWYDRDTCTRLLGLCDVLLADVPAYELHFRPGGRVADALEELAQESGASETRNPKPE